MYIYRRAALRASLAGAAMLAPPAIPRAEEALDQTKIIVGFAPGGTSDVAARHLADKMVPRYARNALVDNRPGAAGRIGIDALKAAPPDGRTLLLTPASTVTIYSAVYKKLSYNPFTDLMPVSLVCTFVHGFAVGPMVPAEVKTLAQYAAWAMANPGKSSCGNPGEGSFPDFLSMLLARGLDAPIQPVPYRGGVQPLADMAAGQLASLMLPDGAFLPFTKDGRARAGDQRREALPVLSRCRDLRRAGHQGYRRDGVVRRLRAAGDPSGNRQSRRRRHRQRLDRQVARRGLRPDRHGPRILHAGAARGDDQVGLRDLDAAHQGDGLPADRVAAITCVEPLPSQGSMRVVNCAPSSATKTAISSAHSVLLALADTRCIVPGGSKNV